MGVCRYNGDEDEGEQAMRDWNIKGCGRTRMSARKVAARARGSARARDEVEMGMGDQE